MMGCCQVDVTASSPGPGWARDVLLSNGVIPSASGSCTGGGGGGGGEGEGGGDGVCHHKDLPSSFLSSSDATLPLVEAREATSDDMDEAKSAGS